MWIKNEQLRQFIEDAGLVKGASLDSTFQEAEKEKKELGNLLVEKELLTSQQLGEMYGYILGIAFVDLSKEKIDPQILKIIPEPIARKNNIIAYKKDDTNLEVAMTNPEDLQTIDFIRKKTGLKILPRLTNEEGIRHVLDQYEESLEKEFKGLIDEETGEATVEKSKDGKEPEAKELEKEAREIPIIRIVDSILRHAIRQRASDIHVEPEEKDVLIRYRIDGILHDAMTLPKQVQTGIVARVKVLSDLRLDEHRLPQDGRFTIQSEDYKVSFRVSVIPVFDGEKLVMRLLPEGSKGYTLEQLGFWGQNLERIHKAVKRPVGMLLATGPTGSGKTTTLYTIMDIINTPGVNISTIEDPVEYRMPRINQTQVRPEIGLSFANGLRSLVRQDPDIIMVGEIRDKETAGLAINAALTGHLVLSTLHTNSAAGSMPRLLDMEQEPFLVSSTLNIAIGQRLVRQLCPDTKKKYNLTKNQIEELGKNINLERILKTLKDEKVVAKNATWETIDFYKPVPSDDCPDGYKDRIGIHEVLEVTETIRRLINNRATIKQINEQAESEGMLTMMEEGIIKAAQGITTIEEVLRVTEE